MKRSLRLATHVRRALSTTIADPHLDQRHKVTLTIANILIRELQLQEDTTFYLAHLEHGKILLAEGRRLLAKEDAGTNIVRENCPGEATTEFSFNTLNDRIEQLNHKLSGIVAELDENRSNIEKDFLVRLSQWESSVYKRRIAEEHSAVSQPAAELTAEALQAYLRKKFSEADNLQVTKFTKVEGGLSKMTVMFETHDDTFGTRALVMRAEQHPKLLHFDGSEVTKEFYLIALMHKMGMPVPEPIWLEDDETLLGFRFLVSAKAEGQNFVSGLASLGGGGERPPELINSMLQTYYRLHSLKIDPTDPLVLQSHLAEWLPYKTLRDIAHYNARVYLPKLVVRAGIKPTPQLVRALRWLENNVPDVDEPPVLVHNDFGFNNLLFTGNTVSAVLDWEVSRLGDPADDMLWTQLSMDVYSMPEFIRIYNEATGRNVTAFRVAYARLQRCVLHMVAGLTAMQCLDGDDDAPLHMGAMAFNLMAQFGADVNELIEAAETARGTSHKHAQG